MTEFVNKSIKSSVYKNEPVGLDKFKTTRSWTGEITVAYTGEFETQTDADAFVHDMTTTINKLTQPTTERFVDRVKDEAQANDVINTFNLNTSSGSAIWGEEPGDR